MMNTAAAAVGREAPMTKELVRDWMTADVVTIAPETTLPEAHQIMTNEEIRRLPVVDRSGRLIGIVSLGDIRSAEPSPATSLSIWEMNYLLSSLTIDQIMTKNPVTIGADATLAEAARLMLEHRVSGLPVVDAEQRVIGIITESDIFSMVVIHEWSAERI
jgi:acetoin utilization protein AcuB